MDDNDERMIKQTQDIGDHSMVTMGPAHPTSTKNSQNTMNQSVQPKENSINPTRRATTGNISDNTIGLFESTDARRNDHFKPHCMPNLAEDREPSSVPRKHNSHPNQKPAQINGTSYERMTNVSWEKDRLSREDRQLIDNFRSAVEGVRSKLAALKQRVEENDNDIDLEQEAVELNFDRWVDMYSDPSVNEELRSKLDRRTRGRRRGRESRGFRQRDLQSPSYNDEDDDMSSNHRGWRHRSVEDLDVRTHRSTEFSGRKNEKKRDDRIDIEQEEMCNRSKGRWERNGGRQYALSASDDELVIGHRATRAKMQHNRDRFKDNRYNHIVPTQNDSHRNVNAAQNSNVDKTRSISGFGVMQNNHDYALSVGAFNASYMRMPMLSGNQYYGNGSPIVPYYLNTALPNGQALYPAGPFFNPPYVGPVNANVYPHAGNLPPYWSVVPPQISVPSQHSELVQNQSLSHPIEMHNGVYPCSFGSPYQQPGQISQNNPGFNHAPSGEKEVNPTGTRSFVNDQQPQQHGLLTTLAQQTMSSSGSTQLKNISTVADTDGHSSPLRSWANSVGQTQQFHHPGGTTTSVPTLREQFAKLTQPVIEPINSTSAYSIRCLNSHDDVSTRNAANERIAVYANDTTNMRNAAEYHRAVINKRSKSADNINERRRANFARSSLTSFSEIYAANSTGWAIKEASHNDKTSEDLLNGVFSARSTNPVKAATNQTVTFSSSHHRNAFDNTVSGRNSSTVPLMSNRNAPSLSYTYVHNDPSVSDHDGILRYRQSNNFNKQFETSQAANGPFRVLRETFSGSINPSQEVRSGNILWTEQNKRSTANNKITVSVASSQLGRDGAGTSKSQFKGRISQQLHQQITLLLGELEAAKDLNIVLQDKLLQSEQDLLTLKLFSLDRDTKLSSQVSSRLSNMIQEIYEAERLRDETLIHRVKRSEEERDDALRRLQALKKQMSKSETADHSSEEKLRNAQNEIIELSQYKKEVETCREKLAQQEVDIAFLQLERIQSMTRFKEMDLELTALRHNYSETMMWQTSQFAGLTPSAVESELTLRGQTIVDLRVENAKLVSQNKELMDRIKELDSELSIITTDRQSLTDQLVKTQYTLAAEQDKCQKSQRLVVVLRRKLSGLGLDDQLTN